MNAKSILATNLRNPAAKSLWCLLLLVSILLLGGRVEAQQNVTPETLGSLVEGLQLLQEENVLPGFGDTGNVLNSVRNAAKRAAEQGEVKEPNEIVLTNFERILARGFCRNLLNESESKAFESVGRFSRLERDYCLRAQDLLEQVGYELFEGKFAPSQLLNGAAPQEYELGIGDQLIVTFVGQKSSTQEVEVDREGRVSVQELPPIAAAGLTLGEFRRELDVRAGDAFIATDAFVSLGAVRQISVLVAGEVNKPGVHQVTALSSVLDALGLAGGIKKTGSLRRIQVHRGDDVFWVDIYDLILGLGVLPKLNVAEGDRIVVPSIGDVVAIAGDVKRPGIFELAEGQAVADFDELMVFSGGTLRPRGAVFERIRFDARGLERFETVRPNDLQASDGDLIMVRRGADNQVGGVTLTGHVRVPGLRSLASAGTVGALLGDDSSLLRDPYLLFGILETTDSLTSSRRYFPLSLQKIMQGAEDYSLRDGDKVIVLSKIEVEYLSSFNVQSIISFDARDEEVLAGRSNLQKGQFDLTSGSLNAEMLQQLVESASIKGAGDSEDSDAADDDPESRSEVEGNKCASLRQLGKLVSETRAGRFSNAVVGVQRPNLHIDRLAKCLPIYEDNDGLLSFVLEHGAAVTGEVRAPGIYPVVPSTGLASVVGVAGGLTREIDFSRIELSKYAGNGGNGRNERQQIDASGGSLDGVFVGPGDVIRFNAVFSDRDSGPVFLVGEFVRPGSFEIRRGERLSEVVARAGGVTVQAYPFGAIFTRERVQRAERASLRRLARELNAAVTVAAANRGINAGAIASFAALTEEISQAPASGRVVIEADPTVLQVRPELDIVLEPGDRVFMPKRPNSVLVTGDVLNPGAMQFVTGKGVDTYIRQAGGFQQSADRNRLFVVFPNGVAQPISVSAFNFTPVRVPPGSAIVVPKDATPFDLFSVSRELSTVLSQMAITAASLAVIGNN